MLIRNDIFIDSETGRRARLLYANPMTNEAATFDMSNPDALPVIEPLDVLIERERSKIITTDAGVLTPTNANRASAKAQNRAELAWSRIAPLVSQVEIYSKETRYPLIRDRARELGCSEVTLLKDLRRYWFGGQSKTALVAKFHLCGHKSEEHQSSAGRKPHLSSYEIFRISQQDKANMRKAIKTHYLRTNRPTASTITDTYQRLLEEHYSFNDGNGNRVINSVGFRPTLRQFYSFLHKNFSFEQITRRRKSDAEFEREHAAKTGSSLLDCLGIGDKYEIDATVADIYLVSRKDRSHIIGKPTLYLVVDRHSRLIVGFYVGLESASWPAAMHAILSIAEDKVTLCARYGLEYKAEDWPADGIFPSMFLADRGSEMMSQNSSLLVNGLQITVGNLPKQRPDYKPMVECGFKLLHRAMVDSVPGYEPPDNVFKRQGMRYDKDASLTLDEFISIVIKAIIVHNNTPMPNYPLPVEAVLAGKLPTPINIWNDGIPYRMGALTRFPVDHVRFSLLPTDEAAVDEEGIFFKGCFYSAPKEEEDSLFVKAIKGTAYIDISYDQRLVDAIYIHDAKDPTKFCVARLDKKCEEYRGLSFAEVKAYELMRSKLKPQCEQKTRQLRSDFHAFVDPIAFNARKVTKAATKGKSRTSRKADISEDRLDERRVKRQEEAAMPSIDNDGNDVLSISSLNQANENANQVYRETVQEAQAPISDSALRPKTLSLQEKFKLKRLEMENATH